MTTLRCFWRVLGVTALVLGCSLTAQAAAGRDQKDIVAAARKIDGFITAGYAEAGVKPTAPANDYVFLRRAYLDIIGRNPTMAETKAFLASKDRRKLIDTLLDSEGYVNHAFAYWADLLRIKTTLGPQSPGNTYVEWFKDSLRSNKPYDKMVYEMISAEGRLMDNGAVGYMIRDTGMPLDNMAVTVRVFLGTSIGCAQCHDHPFDKWTQLEFYSLSAYTYGLEYRTDVAFQGSSRNDLFRQIKAMGLPANVENFVGNNLTANAVGLGDNAKREIKLPDDYKYDDAKPGQVVKPMTIFGSDAQAAGAQTARQAYAKWITDRENPRFALTIANRLWKKVMGQALLEPVDEITDKTKPSHPDLMKFLTEQMLVMNFDIKDFQRMLYYTDTYQKSALLADLGPNDVYAFQGRLVKRMSAEQMWDCMVTLAVADPDSLTRGYTPGGQYFDISGKSAKDIADLAKLMREDPKKARDRMMAGNNEKREKLSPMGAGVVRAAAMESPAPAGHFLRQFGQSDREQVDASSTNPNISQVLDLLNGDIDGIVLDQRSELMKTLNGIPKSGDKVQAIFMAILCRPASSGEVSFCVKAANGDKGIGNVIWALLNTREFMFVQ